MNRRRNLSRTMLFSVALLAASSGQGFFDIIGPIVEVLQAPATKAEQLIQIKRQVEQLDAIKQQTEHLIKHSERYQGANAWRAAVEIRALTKRLKQVHANGTHVATASDEAARRLLAVLPTDADFRKARTPDERAAWNLQQELATRDALRDALRATVPSSREIHAHLEGARADVERVSRDLGSTQSQLAALQLIGEANTQTATHLQVLTKAIVSQTDLLTNIYAKQVAAEDRQRGENAQIARRKIVPSHLVEKYEAEGKHVEPAPAALDELLRD